jgi:hypothetical protein
MSAIAVYFLGEEERRNKIFEELKVNPLPLDIRSTSSSRSRRHLVMNLRLAIPIWTGSYFTMHGPICIRDSCEIEAGK